VKFSGHLRTIRISGESRGFAMVRWIAYKKSPSYMRKFAAILNLRF